MLTKISSKRDELALQWNTRIEVAARLLVISFSILGTFMGYFISAGCAMAYNNIKNLTGVIFPSNLWITLYYCWYCWSNLCLFFLLFYWFAIYKIKKSSQF